MLGWIAALFKPASELGKAYIDGKNRIQQAKIEAKVAKWVAVAAAHEADANRTHTWEMEALRQSQYSWKDEMWSVVLAVLLLSPMLMGIIGVFTENIAWGQAVDTMWKVYGEMPIALQVLYPAAILASFGIRYKGKTRAAEAIKDITDD